MAAERIPVLLLDEGTAARAGRRLRALGRPLLKAFPSIGPAVEKIGLGMEPEDYLVASVLSSFVYGLIFFAVVLAATAGRSGFEPALRTAAAIGIGIWAVFFSLHIVYPGIILKKIAAKESKDLLFALRELTMDVQSGVPLFDSMKNVGSAGYGYVSRDFEWAMKLVDGGVPETQALKRLALKTDSEYMKRAVWQIVNALEAGARMEEALSSIVSSLEAYIYRDIKNYSSNLNVLMLLYMLGAAVVPSLGITFLVLLSAFSGLGVSLQTVGMLVAASAVLQLVMIGYMSITRPEIFGG